MVRQDGVTGFRVYLGFQPHKSQRTTSFYLNQTIEEYLIVFPSFFKLELSRTLNVDDSETNTEVAVVRGNQVLNVTLVSPLEFSNYTIRISKVKTHPVTMTKVSFAVGQVQKVQLVKIKGQFKVKFSRNVCCLPL